MFARVVLAFTCVVACALTPALSRAGAGTEPSASKPEAPDVSKPEVRKPRVILIRAAELHVGDGRVHAPGQMLLENGRIKSLGSHLDAPEGAETWDEPSGVISPWLVDPSVHVALGAGEAGKLESALLSTADARPLFDPFLPILREQGLFAVALVPEGGSDILGRSVVIGTLGPGAGGAPILTPDAQLVMDATSSASSTAAAASRLFLAEMLDATERYSKKRAEWAAKSGGAARRGSKPSEDPKLDPSREILARVNDKSLPLRVVVDRAADVSALLALAKKRGLSLTLVGCRECGPIAELVGESQASVILEPARDSVTDVRGLPPDLDLAASLAKAGVRLAVSTGGAWPTGPTWLRVVAADLAGRGVPREVAIAAMSGEAARAAGLAEPYLLAGQPARFLVWDRDPLDPLARPLRRVVPADVGFEKAATPAKGKP